MSLLPESWLPLSWVPMSSTPESNSPLAGDVGVLVAPVSVGAGVLAGVVAALALGEGEVGLLEGLVVLVSFASDCGADCSSVASEGCELEGDSFFA